MRHTILLKKALICSGICDSCRRAVSLGVWKSKWCWPYKVLCVQECIDSASQAEVRIKRCFLVHENCLWKYLPKLMLTAQYRKQTQSFGLIFLKSYWELFLPYFTLLCLFYPVFLIKYFQGNIDLSSRISSCPHEYKSWWISHSLLQCLVSLLQYLVSQTPLSPPPSVLLF